MNTLMAGAGLKKANRGRFTAAGYVHDEAEERESDLYIERVQAGSAHDLMRDNNRVGYGADELDGDGLPFTFFIDEAQKEEERTRAKQERAHKAKKEKALTLTERIARAVRRERRMVAVCCALLALNLTLLSFWGQAMIDGVHKRDMIAMYERGAKDYQMEIDAANVKLAQASDGERVRNKAQNELGMLRGERVATQKIYIQTSGLTAAEPVQEVARDSTSLLDWLLSVADIFDFKS